MTVAARSSTLSLEEASQYVQSNDDNVRLHDRPRYYPTAVELCRRAAAAAKDLYPRHMKTGCASCRATRERECHWRLVKVKFGVIEESSGQLDVVGGPVRDLCDVGHKGLCIQPITSSVSHDEPLRCSTLVVPFKTGISLQYAVSPSVEATKLKIV